MGALHRVRGGVARVIQGPQCGQCWPIGRLCRLLPCARTEFPSYFRQTTLNRGEDTTPAIEGAKTSAGSSQWETSDAVGSVEAGTAGKQQQDGCLAWKNGREWCYFLPTRWNDVVTEEPRSGDSKVVVFHFFF